MQNFQTEEEKTGRPRLRFKDVCKQDLILLMINLDTWVNTAQHHLQWQQSIRSDLVTYETITGRLREQGGSTNNWMAPENHQHHWERLVLATSVVSRIGLCSYMRDCMRV